MKPVSDIFVSILNNKIEELKETSGNRDFTQGGTVGGVTAASAIAALQEAGSKLSRDMIKASYRAFTQVCYLIIELMRQFYDEPRSFRIVGERGAQSFVLYSNARLRPRAPGMEYGVPMGGRVPHIRYSHQAAKDQRLFQSGAKRVGQRILFAGLFQPGERGAGAHLPGDDGF